MLADKLPRTDSVAKTFNITTSSSDSYIAFVNNLGANLHIGFGIRDNEGNWATTAGPVWTFGQSQDCDNSSRSMAEAPSDDEGGDSSGPGNDGSDAHNGGDGGSSTGAVVGGVVGGIAVAAALALGLAWYLGWCCFPGKRKKNNGNETGDGPSYAANHGGQGNYSPRPNSANAFLNNDPYGRSSGQGSGYAGPLPTHSRSSFETANRPMSQVSSGYNQQMGGFRLANPDNPDTEEALYPPSAAYTQPMHSRHESWDSVGSHRSHSQFPSNPSSEGQFMGSPRQSQMPAGLDDEVPMSVSEKTAALMAESGQHRGSSRQVMQHTDGGPAPSSSQAQDHEELPPACQYNFLILLAMLCSDPHSNRCRSEIAFVVHATTRIILLHPVYKHVYKSLGCRHLLFIRSLSPFGAAFKGHETSHIYHHLFHSFATTRPHLFCQCSFTVIILTRFLLFLLRVDCHKPSLACLGNTAKWGLQVTTNPANGPLHSYVKPLLTFTLPHHSK